MLTTPSSLSLTTACCEVARRAPDPTPDEIRQRCLEIRSTWSELKELRRMGDDKPPSNAAGIREYAFEWIDGTMYLKHL